MVTKNKPCSPSLHTTPWCVWSPPHSIFRPSLESVLLEPIPTVLSTRRPSVSKNQCLSVYPSVLFSRYRWICIPGLSLRSSTPESDCHVHPQSSWYTEPPRYWSVLLRSETRSPSSPVWPTSGLPDPGPTGPRNLKGQRWSLSSERLSCVMLRIRRFQVPLQFQDFRSKSWWRGTISTPLTKVLGKPMVTVLRTQGIYFTTHRRVLDTCGRAYGH